MIAVSELSQDSANKVGSALTMLVLGNESEELIFADPVDLDGTKKIALFIHGFTANASYMMPLMKKFAKNGYLTLAFNYPCYDGIDKAAKRLREFLEKFDELSDSVISKNRIVVVGHSMGGLVARALISLEGGDKYVRKVFTLGSPHAGTLINSRYVQYFVSCSESLSGLVKGGFSKSSLSARQLTRADKPQPLLDKLALPHVPKNSVEFHSISGGRNYLTFERNAVLSNPVFERVMNAVIQKHLGNLVNDGLVLETSSDLSKPEFQKCANGCVHHNSYGDYNILNHSNLCNSEILALTILSLA